MELRTKVLSWAVGVGLVSAGGVALLVNHEGYRNTSYPDPGTGGAPWTICVGHTGPEVKPRMTVSDEQCRVWLYKDIKTAERCLISNVRVPLRQTEWDAYVSFVFNLGCGSFKSSTMLRKLNAGDHAGACNQFPRWVYADKRVLRGLVVRRTAEQNLCHQYSKVIYDPRQPSR